MRTASKIVTILILLLISSFSSAFGETWDDIASLAKSNDQLVSAGRQLESARWSYNRAWSGFLPQISLNASYSERLGGGTSETTGSYSWGINATQSLFKGMQNYYGLKSSWANYEQTNASYKKTESDVYYGLRSAFVGLYIAQENLDLSSKILAQLKENARLIKLRYDSGREDRGNLLSTQASAKDGEAAVSSAKRELELARLKLFQLTSREVVKAEGPLDLTFEASPDFPALNDGSPALLMAKYQLEVADIAAQNTIGEFLPTLSLSGNYSKSGSDWPPEGENKSWGLNLSYSLFPGGANFADKMINDINLEKARKDYEIVFKDNLYTIEDAHRRVKDSVDALEVRKIFLDAAAERSKIADAKYLNGLITYDEWNRITNDYISAQKSVLQARRSALEAAAALKNSYGGK